MTDPVLPDSCAATGRLPVGSAEAALARMTEALAAPGDEFYSRLFDYAAEELAVATVFVAGLEPGHESATIRSIATQGGLAVGDTYQIADTPCIDVIGGKECVIRRDGAEQACPGLSDLVGEPVEGYIGFPLLGAYGQPLGLLGRFDI